MSRQRRVISGDWYGNTAVVLAVLVVAAILLATTVGGKKHTAQQPGAPASAPKQSRAPTAVPSATATSASAQLSNQVRAFLETFYTIYPTDTATSRRQRLAALRPAPSQSFLDQLDLGFDNKTKADQARTGKTIKAQAPTSDMIAEPVNGNAQRMQFTSNVTFTQTGSGSLSSGYGLTVTTVWQYGAGYWQIVQFSQGVSTS